MDFREKDYFRASQERIRQAQGLFQSGSDYALAMFCSGLAVECLLRAFRWRYDPRFEGRHDLQHLLKASQILRVDEDYMRRRGKSEVEIDDSVRKFRADMNEIVRLWHNNLRYASESRLKTYLASIHRSQRVKGDSLKKNATDLLQAAQNILNRGVVLWESRIK